MSSSTLSEDFEHHENEPATTPAVDVTGESSDGPAEPTDEEAVAPVVDEAPDSAGDLDDD